MKYYSENTVKGLLEQIDSHFVKYLDSMPSIKIKEPHGRLGDLDALRIAYLNKIGIHSESFLLESQKEFLRCIKDAPTVLEATKGRKK